jgi:ferredoxin
MSEAGLNLTRRKFMMVSSAAIAAPLFLNLPGMAPEARGSLSGKIYYVTNECVGCQTCRLFCPAGAIRFGDCRMEIDQDKCLHCGSCYRECVVAAISVTSV